jgi:hypothetical protein
MTSIFIVMKADLINDLFKNLPGGAGGGGGGKKKIFLFKIFL